MPDSTGIGVNPECSANEIVKSLYAVGPSVVSLLTLTVLTATSCQLAFSALNLLLISTSV